MVINKKQGKKKELELIALGEVFSDGNYYYMRIEEIDGYNAVGLEYGDLYGFDYDDEFYLENAELIIK